MYFYCIIVTDLYLFYVYPMYIPSHIYLAFERLTPLPGRRSGSALPEPAALVGVEAKPFFLRDKPQDLIWKLSTQKQVPEELEKDEIWDWMFEITWDIWRLLQGNTPEKERMEAQKMAKMMIFKFHAFWYTSEAYCLKDVLLF